MALPVRSSIARVRRAIRSSPAARLIIPKIEHMDHSREEENVQEKARLVRAAFGASVVSL